MSKPYFLPLNGEYYIKIVSGEQDCEIRPLNHRGWNTKNIYHGRELNFSYGYGKQRRTLKAVTKTHIGCSSILSSIGIPDWHVKAVEDIYGKDNQWLVAFV